MLNISKIKYTDSYESKEYHTVSWYFDGPVTLLPEEFPLAVKCDIRLECPIDHIEARYAGVEISPVIEEDGGELSVYWTDWELPYEDIEKLLDLAKRHDTKQNEYLSPRDLDAFADLVKKFIEQDENCDC